MRYLYRCRAAALVTVTVPPTRRHGDTASAACTPVVVAVRWVGLVRVGCTAGVG